MLEALVLSTTFGLVYGLAWIVAWLLRKVIALPAWVALPWLLFQSHLVIGLIITGDLSGSSRAVIPIAGVMALLSILLSLITWLRRRDSFRATVNSFLVSGMAPWVVALFLALLL